MKIPFTAILLSVPAMLSAAITPLPEKSPGLVADQQAFLVPDRVKLTGWLGTRIDANVNNRLVKIDTGRLLEGYRKRPGRQTWDGEHVGKWLHAATLAWVYNGDPALRAKLDETAAELGKCQLADGYLGTYVENDRWSAWDVWAHKYNLLGLITYMRYTGNLAPLPTCQRMADLLCKTFGDGPGQKDITLSGFHSGMASSSVLEPMVLLYRFTGEKRYLDFCNYIVRATEGKNGPHIVSRLLDSKGVNEVGNAKAYEMLSCLNGLLELYRTTGEKKLLDASLKAWQDIVDHQLYITGAASYCEYFHDNHDLPNNNKVGETCVTVTWLQFNTQLLRLTGEARFSEQLERVAMNQLLGAQKPDGTAWGYYVQMEGKKPYKAELDGHCCLSSGPRGIALLPTFAITTDSDGAVVNLYEPGAANLTLKGGRKLALRIESKYPADGQIRITIDPAEEGEFSVKFRLPSWSKGTVIRPAGAITGKDGYTVLRRTWKAGDSIDLDLKIELRVVVGDQRNQGKAVIFSGPLVLAADEALHSDPKQSLTTFTLVNPPTGIVKEPATLDRKTWPDAALFRVNANTKSGDTPFAAHLVPFADAGMTGERYKVWLPLAGQKGANLLAGGIESRSRNGKLTGSIIDDDFQSIAATNDGKPASEDWFAIKLPSPVTARQVVFVHGKNLPDGGWFDTSAAKPKLQIQRTNDSGWEAIGEFADYPATTAVDPGNDPRLSWGNNHFVIKLADSTTFVGIRVIGAPSSGNDPKQSSVTCTELQAFDH
ncbi:MAG: beta-L-arabinofuranosidase domain-containing protein [Luteolibacter sp.]